MKCFIIFKKDISEGAAGQAAELRVIDQRPHERLLDRFSGNYPQFLPAGSFGTMPTGVFTHRSARDKGFA